VEIIRANHRAWFAPLKGLSLPFSLLQGFTAQGEQRGRREGKNVEERSENAVPGVQGPFIQTPFRKASRQKAAFIRELTGKLSQSACFSSLSVR
jgi:hypothetical protein